MKIQLKGAVKVTRPMMKPVKRHDPEQLHSISIPQILYQFTLKIILQYPLPHHGKTQKITYVYKTMQKRAAVVV
jgi:hypothetical protein